MAYTYTNPVTGDPITARLAVPQAFGDAMSYADQILILAHGYDELKSSVDTSHADIYAKIASANAAIDAANDALDELRKYTDEQLAEVSVGTKVYDVFTGAYEENQTAMRTTVRYLAVHAITVGELNSMSEKLDSVTALANCGLNCIGLAVVGNWLYSQGYDVPERYQATGRIAGNALNSKDYPKLMLDSTNKVYLP